MQTVITIINFTVCIFLSLKMNLIKFFPRMDKRSIYFLILQRDLFFAFKTNFTKLLSADELKKNLFYFNFIMFIFVLLNINNVKLFSEGY